MSLTVKAFLTRGEANPEIRRFAVDQDVTTNHVYLRGKVTQMFPALKNKGFDLFWKDDENDLIAFSSDAEQTEALGFVADAVFKIYIKETGKPERQENEPDVLHPNIVCDGCDGSVRGFRFKCVACPDYDLCSQCESKGLHTEHDMMRISTPRSTGGWMGYGMFPPPPPPGVPTGPPPHFRGPPPYGSWDHRKAQEISENIWKKFFKSEGNKKYKGKDNSSCDVCKDDSTCSKTKRDARPKSEGASKPPPKASGDASSDEGETSPTEDYLKNIGANVAAMLDPLGIDVEIDVEHKGNRQRCGTSGQEDFQPWMWAPFWRGRGRHCRRGARGPRGHGHGGPWAWRGMGKPQEAEKEPKEDDKTPKTNTDVEMETGETPKASTSMTSDKVQTDSAMESQEASSSKETGETETQQVRETPSPEKDWTFVDSRSGSSEDQERPTGGATSNIYPEVPQPVETAPPRDPAIANALDHMQAMGFNDEGGWLTHLLQVSGGDINKALDAIRANRNV